MKKLKKQKNPKKTNLILIGLGNPGAEFRETRHNAGFAVIDFLSEKYNKPLKKVFLKPVETAIIEAEPKNIVCVKPLTYMNRSGMILDYILHKFNADTSDIAVICDNMDLEPGIIRLKKNGSSAGHNGIKSIMEYLDDSDFARLYIGVGRSRTGETVVEHVLGRFSEDDYALFRDAVERAADALVGLARKSPEQVMNEINKKNK